MCTKFLARRPFSGLLDKCWVPVVDIVWTVIYGIFVIALIACGKLPVMGLLDRYLEVTRIQGRNQVFKKKLGFDVH